MTETARDRRRITAAAAVALVLHGVLFLLFPRVGLPADDPFEAPLYVAFDPVQPEEREEAQVEPEPPVREIEPELEPEPEPEPDENLAATTPAAPEPAPPSADARSASEAAESVPGRSSSGEAAGGTDAVAERTPEPAPPPPPAPERSFDPAGLQPTTSDRAEIQASQLREISEMQTEYLNAVAEWEARQEERADETSRDSDAATPSDDAPPRRLNDFQDQLSDLIDGIRSADNVVSTDPRRDPDTGDRPSSGSESAADADEPGSGAVTIEDAGGGTRRLLTDPTVDVSSVSSAG